MSSPTYDPRPANQQRTCTYLMDDESVCGKPFLAQTDDQEVCPNHAIAQAGKKAAERRKIRSTNFRDRMFGR